MNSYGQYCPVARAMDVLGDRWTMLVMRDLLTGSRRFNDLARGLPRMSRSLLSKRLAQLQEAGVVEHVEDEASGGSEYRPTQAGWGLWHVLEAVMSWGARWAFDQPRDAELDPVLLMWWIRRGTIPDRVPRRRVTIRFELTDDDRRFYWLVVDRSDVSVCMDPPAFDVDLHVETDLATLYRVWLNRVDYHDALANGTMRVHGPPTLERDLPRWFDWSPAAGAVQAAWADAT